MEPTTPNPESTNNPNPERAPRPQGQGQNRNQRFGNRPRPQGQGEGQGGQPRPAGEGQPAQPGQTGPAQNGQPQGGAPRPQNANRSRANSAGRERRRRGGQQLPAHTDLMPALDAMPVNKSAFNGSEGAQQTKGKPARAANAVNNEPRIKVIPLGGLGEIGKNMMAVEYENDIVIIDMGFAFPDEKQPGVDYIIPDTTYLEKNKHKVRAIIITHGHMDHIGAAGYVIPKFPVPIYGSRLSLAFVEKQISEFRINAPKWVVMDPDKHERVQIGSFNLELVRVTHTISDSTAVVLRTPAGIIINTGDWRPDPTPKDGKIMDFPRFEEIGKEGVLLLMSDSTSCDRVGRTTSEAVIEPTIHDLFSRAEHRIIISSFSSSISRVQLVIDAVAVSGRKLALVGRSTLTNVELCVKMGYLKIPAGLIVRVQDIGNLPDNKIVVLCTGSQGEENSALVRMSTGDHQNIKIKPGDTVILSSSVIPGNEVSVVRLVDNLMREGAILYSRATEELKGHGPVHVGGHAHRGDVGDLVALVKPKFYMPIHGEFHHLVYSAEVAIENGVARNNAFVMDNGDVLELSASSARKIDRVPAGVVYIDGNGVGDVEGVVLRDRLAMGGDGVFMIVATVSRKTGRLISSPDIISRGFIYMKESEELVNGARAEIRKAFENLANQRAEGAARQDWSKFKLNLRDDVADYLYGKTKRNPMVLPVINEV